MLIRELVAMEELRLTLLSDAGHLDRGFAGVHITDLPDPGRYLSGGELVLTGLIWRRDPADSRRFVKALADAGVAALAAGRALLGTVPGDLVEACREHDLPLLDVPEETSFHTLAEKAQAGAGVAADPRGALGRHRRIVAAVAEGTGLDELFALTAQELGVSGAVVSAAGAVVAGRLGAGLAARLAREYLTAPRLPHVARTPEGTFTVFAVDRAHRAAGWALVFESDLTGQADMGFELAACVALARGRTEEGRRVERRLAEQLIGLASSAAPDPAELAARLRTCGVDAVEPYVMVTATAVRPGATDGPDPAALGGQVVEELLERRVVAAVGADGAVALVPLRAFPAPDGEGRYGRAEEAEKRSKEEGPGPGTEARVRSTVQVQGRPHVHRSVHAILGLLRNGVAALQAVPRMRVSIGVSAVLNGPGAVRGGAEEAGHARRLAEARGGGVVTSDEIYTHALLLATVPDDVRRSFADRILEPLFEYDRRHQSELVRTLGVFLDCAGSWNGCATRLHVHVNTVRYRIHRVEELTGRDLSSMADRVDLFLALRAR
ncbi:PucR family transcriptional regulator ligand-binding domain-containing protein [Sphaerisporangium sp. NPDC051017]|uniref:PucR family transcriptional regulator n=1 Tax=unclassified Sphaerisporangium TaxID=2630420 RepID=UPI0033F14B1F